MTIPKLIPWTKKPNGPVKVNKSHPLAKDLIAFVYFNSTPGKASYNAVTDQIFNDGTNNIDGTQLRRSVGSEGKSITGASGHTGRLEIHKPLRPNDYDVYTVLHKVKYASNTVDHALLHTNLGLGSNNVLLWADYESGVGLRAGGYAGGTSYYGTSDALPANEWVTWGAGVPVAASCFPSVYVNGFLDATLGNIGDSTNGSPIKHNYFNRYAASRPLYGECSWVAFWGRELSPEEHKNFNDNPWQVLQPRKIYIPIGATGVAAINLIIQDALHGHTTDPVILTQLHELLINDASHGHLADILNLTQEHQLIINEVLHNHIADNIDVTQNQQLVIDEILHNHLADNVNLTQEHQLSIAEILHSHTADTPVLTQLHVLTINEALHSHTADNVVLAVADLLVIANTLHSHLGDNVALTQDHQLLIAEALHSQTADNPILTQDHQLSVDEALHSHTVDNVVLTEESILGIADALHAHTVDSLVLTQEHQLVISDAIHNHTGETIALTQDHILIVSDSLHVLVSDIITLTSFIPADIPSSRVYAIEFESRIYLITRKSSDRVYSIPKV